MLESEGFDVVGELADGGPGRRAVLALDPDVVLLDVQLPDMSGFDVCALLDAFDGRTVQVILVSSRDLSDYGELVETSCARGFVPKGELSGDRSTRSWREPHLHLAARRRARGRRAAARRARERAP